MLLPEQVDCAEQLEGRHEFTEQTREDALRYARSAAALSDFVFPTSDILTSQHEMLIALQERALQEQKIFVSAFDDPYIIAGQVGQAQTPHWLPHCMAAYKSC